MKHKTVLKDATNNFPLTAIEPYFNILHISNQSQVNLSATIHPQVPHIKSHRFSNHPIIRNMASALVGLFPYK